MAFYKNDDDQNDLGRGRGGGGRGRSGRSGRGRGRGRGRGARGEPINTTNTPTKDSTADGANDNAQFLLDNTDNLDTNEDYSQSSPGITDSCFQMLEQANRLNGNVLLIDSCSSVNLICNSDLLHDIVTVDWRMRVRCNAGGRTTNQRGRLGNFPKPVWYNPKGVANIL